MGGESSAIDYEQGKISASPTHPEEIVRDALLEDEKKETNRQERDITDYEQKKTFARQEILRFLEDFFEKLSNEIAKDKKSKLDFFTAEEIAVRVIDAIRKEMGVEEK